MGTLEKLQLEVEKLEQDNEHWKDCQDGSYEMALDLAGYYRLISEIQKIKEGGK